MIINWLPALGDVVTLSIVDTKILIIAALICFTELVLSFLLWNKGTYDVVYACSLKECEIWLLFVFSFTVGVYVVHHLMQFFHSASLLGLLLVGGSKWLQWVQLVSRFSAIVLTLWNACSIWMELSKQGKLLFIHYYLFLPGQYTTAPVNGGMRQSPSSHPPPWDSATLHSYW